MVWACVVEGREQLVKKMYGYGDLGQKPQRTSKANLETGCKAGSEDDGSGGGGRDGQRLLELQIGLHEIWQTWGGRGHLGAITEMRLSALWGVPLNDDDDGLEHLMVFLISF